MIKIIDTNYIMYTMALITIGTIPIFTCALIAILFNSTFVQSAKFILSLCNNWHPINKKILILCMNRLGHILSYYLGIY